MMPTDMRGTLGRNEKREPGTRQPEYKGSAVIEGCESWISGWVAENERGKYFSLAFTPKEQPKTEARPAASSELRAKYAPNTNGQRTDHRRGVRDEEIPF
jgi:hypothetical protein